MSDDIAPSASKELWRHQSPDKSQIYAFKQHVTQKYKLDLPTYHDLWTWSVERPSAFWEEIWHYTGIIHAKDYDKDHVGQRTALLPFQHPG